MRSNSAHHNRDVNLSVSEQLRIGDELRKRQRREVDDSEEVADQLMDGDTEALEKVLIQLHHVNMHSFVKKSWKSNQNKVYKE
jgi:U3 small nucleolar RNA-associated protein 14